MNRSDTLRNAAASARSSGGGGVRRTCGLRRLTRRWESFNPVWYPTTPFVYRGVTGVNDLLQEGVTPVYLTRVRARPQGCVRVQRDRRRLVPQHALNQFHRTPGFDERGRKAGGGNILDSLPETWFTTHMTKTPESDRCVACDSENLFSGFFDADDLAVTDDTHPGTRWTTFCNECGSEQTTARERAAVIDRSNRLAAAAKAARIADKHGVIDG